MHAQRSGSSDDTTCYGGNGTGCDTVGATHTGGTKRDGSRHQQSAIDPESLGTGRMGRDGYPCVFTESVVSEHPV
jgi:hypothetical protein